MKTSTDIPKASGIYRISCGPRTFYWGQSQDLRGRLASHLCDLRMGTHSNSRLQRSFDKHGEGAFSFEVSLLCPAEDLDMQEQFALDIYHGTPGCANIARVAEAPARGYRHSEETKAKIVAASSGRKLSAEARAKISEAKRGVPRTTEAVRASTRGRRALHPNILVERTDGTVEIWPSQWSLARHLGFGNNGRVQNWLSGRDPIPAKYNIVSVSRTELPVTINPEAL